MLKFDKFIMLLKILRYFIIVVFIPFYVFGQNDYFKQRFDSIWSTLNDTLFLELLDFNELSLNIPDSFVATKVIKNYDSFYQYNTGRLTAIVKPLS